MITLAGMRLKTATLRGLRTAWLDNENAGKEVLLFIHGYLDTPDTWSAQAAAFAESHQILLPFARGVGESEPPTDKRRYGAYSILLDHLEILRVNNPEGKRGVHIVGHDVGGVHAWMLACHPNPAVRTVTILNSAHPRQYLRRMLWPRQLFKSWYMGAFQIPYLSETLLFLFHRKIFSILSAEGWRPPAGPAFGGTAVGTARAGNPAGEMSFADFEGAAVNAMNQYRQFVRDIPHFLRERAAPAGVPVLVLSSEEDRYLEAPSGPEFADIAKKVTIRVVKGGHWIHREQPERINRLLADFIRADK